MKSMSKLVQTALSLVMLCALLSPLAGQSSLAVDTPADWAAQEVTLATQHWLVPSEWQDSWDAPVTRAEFARAAVYYFGASQHMDYASAVGVFREKAIEITGAPYPESIDPNDWTSKPFFSDTDDYFAETAYALGIVQGRDDGTFDPDGLVTRQEAAAMLLRAYDLFGMVNRQEKAMTFPQTFSDSGLVADYAGDACAFLYQMGVMRGTTEGLFDPLGTYTRQQCIVTFWRLYQEGASLMRPLLPYEEARARALGQVEDVVLPRFSVLFSQECAQWSVYYTTQTGTSHGSAYTLTVVYQDGGMREILHGGEGLPSSSPFRSDLELTDLRISADEKTLTCKREWDGSPAVVTVDLETARWTQELLPAAESK